MSCGCRRSRRGWTPELELGRHAALIGELEALAASEPTRELVAGQLALALYRSGRQADALEALRRTRERMREDLGLDPGAALRLLQDQILRQDPALVPVERTPLPDELDAALATPLHGRERELAELRAAWARVRAGAALVVTVSGLRGSGTTRLAAELAAEVHAGGAPVVYDDTGGSALRPSDARPALLVLDNLPLVEAPRDAFLLTLVCGPDAHETDHVDAAIRLGALDARAVGAIAAGYARAHVPGHPGDELLGMSGGLPGPVHQCARRWAQREAGRHVEAVAGRTAAGRADLRSMELELTGGVAELQATHDRAAPPPARRRSLVCPYKGLAAFDAADSEYYCGRDACGRARGAPGRHIAAGPRRPIGQRQVLALARWSAGRVGRRHPAGKRALAADPDPAGRTSTLPRWPTSTSAVASCWPSTNSRRRSPPARTSPSAAFIAWNWSPGRRTGRPLHGRARAPC